MAVKKYLPSCMAVFSLLMVAGCGSKYDFCDFEGVVTWNGEVVPGISMEIKSTSQDIRASMADTGVDGTFKAAVTATQTGVMSGENDVTFTFDRTADMWDSGEYKESPALAIEVAKYSKEHGPIRIEVKGTNRDYRFELPLAE